MGMDTFDNTNLVQGCVCAKLRTYACKCLFSLLAVICFNTREGAILSLPVWQESRPQSGAHEFLHAVLVGGSEEQPAAAGVQLVELGSKVINVLQA